jgi:hypothetical protein
MLAADEQSLRDPPPTSDNESLKLLRQLSPLPLEELQAAQRSERYKP